MNYTGEDGIEHAAVFIGGLEECKYVMDVLGAAEVPNQLDVAERAGEQFASRGYYLVSVAADAATHARDVIEKQLREDLQIHPGDESQIAEERCPACGTLLVPGCASCQECGLMFE
ncbi:hypothetical protein GX586_08115 [bacterium]|nr:hypothetical protein [bacterium]